MVAVTTAGGLELTVTDRHPMLVLTGGRPEVREARDLAPGDLIPTFSGFPEAEATGSNPRLDVVGVLSPEQRGRTRVRLTDGTWEQYRPALYEARGSAARDFIRDEAVPLELYLRLEEEGRLPGLRQRLQLMTGRGPSWSSFPAVLELTPDFARLVGYYLSEGCISQDRSPRVRFSFHADEAEYVADVIALLNRLGLRVSEHKDRQWQTLHVRVASSLFGAVMRDGLGCGRHSYEMRIPPVLLAAPAPHRLALLTGFLRGDGDVWARSGFRTYRKNGRVYRHRDAGGCIGYFSVSEQLGRGVVYLMQSLGFSPQVSRKKTQSGLRIRLHGAQALERLAPLLGGEKGRRLAESLEARQRRPLRRAVRETGAFTAVPVLSVRRFPGSTFVYSVETEGTHTFAAGLGRFVHNCIPVDPLYLSWKVRLTGYEAQFIALADQINRAMPEHVVGLVADALNDRGKALRGASILVLGVTYKADVNDIRESPALEIIETLHRKGAQVAYADPFVPQLAVNGTKLAAADPTPDALAAADCVLILTNHSRFDYAAIADRAALVVDTRNAMRDYRGSRPGVVTL
jgi:intein/homing endonuclease